MIRRKELSNEDLKITVKEQMVNGEIYFFSTFNRTPTATELSDMPSVNLSRGHNKQYRLDQLEQHNGTGANWTDGRDIHTDKAQFKYRQRVSADVAAAWKQFKANTALRAAKAAAAVKAAADAAQAAKKNTVSSVFFVGNGD